MQSCRALKDFHVYFKNMSGIENALLLTIDLYYGFTFLYSSSIFVLTLTSVDLKSYMFFFWTHSPNKNQIITNNLPYPTIGLGPPWFFACPWQIERGNKTKSRLYLSLSTHLLNIYFFISFTISSGKKLGKVMTWTRNQEN